MDSLGLISALLFGGGSDKITFRTANMANTDTQITIPKAKCIVVLPITYAIMVTSQFCLPATPIILVPGMVIPLLPAEACNVLQDSPKISLNTSGTIIGNVSNWVGYKFQYAHIPA